MSTRRLTRRSLIAGTGSVILAGKASAQWWPYMSGPSCTADIFQDLHSNVLFTSAESLSGSSILTFTDTTGAYDGWLAGGLNIPPFDEVSSHTGTTVTLSDPITADIPADTEVVFTPRTYETFNNASSGSVRIATDKTNDLIFVAVYTKISVPDGGSAFAQSVKSVTSSPSSLTFTRIGGAGGQEANWR